MRQAPRYRHAAPVLLRDSLIPLRAALNADVAQLPMLAGSRP